MTQIVLNVEDALLVPSLKQILGAIKGVKIDKLITNESAIESEKQFISDTITSGYQQAQQGLFAAENLPNLNDLIEELKSEAE